MSKMKKHLNYVRWICYTASYISWWLILQQFEEHLPHIRSSPMLDYSDLSNITVDYSNIILITFYFIKIFLLIGLFIALERRIIHEGEEYKSKL